MTGYNRIWEVLIMNSEFRELRLNQIDRSLEPFSGTQAVSRPRRGWLRSLREALGISMREVARKMRKTPQTVASFEKSEAADGRSETASWVGWTQSERTTFGNSIDGCSTKPGSGQGPIERRKRISVFPSLTFTSDLRSSWGMPRIGWRTRHTTWTSAPSAFTMSLWRFTRFRTGTADMPA